MDGRESPCAPPHAAAAALPPTGAHSPCKHHTQGHQWIITYHMHHSKAHQKHAEAPQPCKVAVGRLKLSHIGTRTHTTAFQMFSACTCSNLSHGTAQKVLFAPESDACSSRQLCQQGDVRVRHQVPPQLTDVSSTHVVGSNVVSQHIHCSKDIIHGKMQHSANSSGSGRSRRVQQEREAVRDASVHITAAAARNQMQNNDAMQLI